MDALNLDVEDKNTGETYTVYKCGECFALVLNVDYVDHYSWHVRQSNGS